MLLLLKDQFTERALINSSVNSTATCDCCLKLYLLQLFQQTAKLQLKSRLFEVGTLNWFRLGKKQRTIQNKSDQDPALITEISFGNSFHFHKSTFPQMRRCLTRNQHRTLCATSGGSLRSQAAGSCLDSSICLKLAPSQLSPFPLIPLWAPESS